MMQAFVDFVNRCALCEQLKVGHQEHYEYTKGTMKTEEIV